MYVDWPNRIIHILQVDLTFISGSLYELDVNQLRLDLKNLEDNAQGMAWPDTHVHNPEVLLSGVTYARTFQIINSYTVTFEDIASPYRVRCVGANHNISDVQNLDDVSLIIGNAAGLIVDQVETLLRKLLQNKQITDPVAGKHRVYDDDDITVLLEADIFEDAAGTTPYDANSTQIERREKLDTP